MHALFSVEQDKCSGALEAVTVYFELYGGSYPHPSVPSATRAPRRPVQPHLWYSPSVALAAFDVQLVFASTSSRAARPPVFLGFDDACAALARVSLPFVPAAFRAPLGVALQWAFDHAADNALAHYNPSGLPLIEGNAGAFVKDGVPVGSQALQVPDPFCPRHTYTGEGFVVRPVIEHTCPEGIQRALTKIKNPAFREIGQPDGGALAARPGAGTTRATPHWQSPAEFAATAAARYLLPARVASVASNQALATVSRAHAAALAELVVVDALKEAEWDPSERCAVEARAGADVFTRTALAAVHAYLDLCDSTSSLPPQPAVAAVASGRSTVTAAPTVALAQRAAGQRRVRGRGGRGTTVGASASRQAAPVCSSVAFEPRQVPPAAAPPQAAPPALPAAALPQTPTTFPPSAGSSSRQVAAPSPRGRAPVRPTVTDAVTHAVPDSGDAPAAVRFALAPASAEAGTAARLFSTSRTAVVASTAGATVAGAAALASVLAADALAASGWGPVECGEGTGSAAFNSAALAAAEAFLQASDHRQPTSAIARGATGTARPDRARSIIRGRRPRQDTVQSNAVNPQAPQIAPPAPPIFPASKRADVLAVAWPHDSHAAEPPHHPTHGSGSGASRWRESYISDPQVPSITTTSGSGPGPSRRRESQPAEPPAPPCVTSTGSGLQASHWHRSPAAEPPAPHATVSGLSRWRESPSAGAPVPSSAATGSGGGLGTIASRWRESESAPSHHAPRVGRSAAPRRRGARV